jgi:diacylglycerol kinase (ATP)
MSEVLYIVNPAGHGGTGHKVWEAFRETWSEPIDPQHVIVTRRPGHAREIATTVDGYDTLAAVGGDGTVSEIMSAMMDREQVEYHLAIVPAGTGNDIARNLGIKSIEDAVDALRDRRPQAVDIMQVESLINDQPSRTYGFLAAAVGFSSIPKIRPWMKRLLGPAGAYYLATILQVISYKPTTMTLRTEGREHEGRSWMIVVGNAESTAGGSMCLAPGARFDDGELNISIFPSGSRISLPTRLMPKIASGEHINEPDVAYFPGKKIEIESDPPAVVELDGDLRGWTPATLTVCPRAVQILTPAKERNNDAPTG